MDDILPTMDWETTTRIFQSAKTELMRHTWDTFVDNPPSVAAGGNGVVIPRCPACHKRINTNDQYLWHLSDDVLPTSLIYHSKVCRDLEGRSAMRGGCDIDWRACSSSSFVAGAAE